MRAWEEEPELSWIVVDPGESGVLASEAIWYVRERGLGIKG